MHRIAQHKGSIARFLGGVILGCIVLIIMVAVWYIRSFTNPAGIAASDIANIITTGIQNKHSFENRKVTFLILGLDNRDDALETTLLTDTIILASLDTGAKKLTLIPLPRDLWIDELKTKINALYYYGEKGDHETGPSYTTRWIEEFTGLGIDYYLVLNYLKIPALIDSLGEVTVDVDSSFTDHEYPNPDYISDQSKPQYITVSFEKGKEKMDGQRALAFIRSRHSNGSQGSDVSRSQRQLQLVNAMIDQVTSRQMILDPYTVGKLYRFWKDEITTNIPDEDLVSIAFALRTKHLTINAVQIPTSLDADKRSIFINPPIEKYGLWVWEPVDPTWEELKSFMEEQL